MRLAAGDRDPGAAAARPEAGAAALIALPERLFSDSRFVVLDKPAGLKVHPGPGGGPSVEDWFGQLSRRRDGPWLAHRLDADTAGCLVVALRRAALHEAQACFAEGRAEKIYWAMVSGAPPHASGTIDLPLAKRSDQTGGWRMVGDPTGAPARTRYEVRGRGDGFTWLEMRLESGRTHQARVHCASLGCPIVGDPVYGNLARADPGTADPASSSLHLPGLHLLARSIALPLTPPLAATAPVPAHMRAALRACGCEQASVNRPGA